MFKIKKDTINSIDLSQQSRFCHGSDLPNFNKNAGQEHYKLLAYISHWCDYANLADIGTRFGSSALALSVCPTNNVKTFDTKVQYTSPKDNIIFSTHNCVDDVSPILDCQFILIDVDPHDGHKEQQILDRLIENNYSGFVLFDDIYWSSMQEFWENITLEKYDITEYGHSTGTGLVNLTNEKVVLE